MSNAHFQVTMSHSSLLGLTPCSQNDADNPLYCVLGAPEDCCNSGVGRISIPSWDINKRQEYASSSGSFDSSYGYYILSTTSTIAGSTIIVTRTVSRETNTQALSPSEATSLPTTSETTTTSPTSGQETLATDISAIDGQTLSASSGLPTGAKAGIGAGIAVAVLLALGLGGAALIFYRRSKLPNIQTNHDNTREDPGEEDFATDRVIPEMDATHSERPAELEDIVLSELLGSFVSRTASQSRSIFRATKGNIHEMEA